MLPPYVTQPPTTHFDRDLSKISSDVGNTPARSNIEIVYESLLAGREEWLAARCLREQLGLTNVDSVRDVLDLDLQTVGEVIAAAEANEAQRVAGVKAERAAYTKQFADHVAEYEAARKRYAKDTLPQKRAVGAEICDLIAELDAEGHFAAMAEAIREEAEAGLPVSDHEQLNARHLREAEAREAEPVPAERFDVLRIQSDPRGWLPECLSLLRAVRDDLQKRRTAHVARVKNDLTLAGMI